MATLRVAIAATRAPWGSAFRAFVRDHASGVSIETLMTPSQLPRPGERPFDVLIVDDQVAVLRAAHIASVQSDGTHVVGVWDETTGRGRDWIVDLGVDEAVAASVGAAGLLQIVLRVGPAPTGIAAADGCPDYRSPDRRPTANIQASRPVRQRQAIVTAWTTVSGGTGSSEALIAASELLAAGRRVLVIEAGGATLAHRLGRAPEYGLSWALERVAAGYIAVPERLTPGRDDGTPPLGRADVICGTTAPSGPPSINAAHLGQLLDQVESDYDHVLVEIGRFTSGLGTGERFGLTRAVLGRAHQAVVFAAADPIGAARLVDWRSVLHHDLELDLPWLAVFGRSPRRKFEQTQLSEAVKASTGGLRCASVRFLPEDPAVGRARWDGRLVTGGPWLRAVRNLAGELAEHTTLVAPAQVPTPRSSKRMGERVR